MRRLKHEHSKPNFWQMQTAKARFSEVIKRAKTDGPQHVTVHGRDEAVVMSTEEFQRLSGAVAGQAVIEALQASPYRDMDIEPPRIEEEHGQFLDRKAFMKLSLEERRRVLAEQAKALQTHYESVAAEEDVGGGDFFDY